MIRLKDICASQGNFRFEQLSLEIKEGEYAVLMGPSGSGKTTLLEIICGIRQVSSGKILIDGKDLTSAAPGAREIGYVPQDGALFKTLSVRENIAFALALRKRPSDEVNQKVTEISALLGVQHLLDRYPKGLSGGERQRIALGRALSFNPKLLLLDEPLSALDETNRARIIELLKHVQRQTQVTTLHVTHNKAEADALGTQGMIIRGGAIQTLDLKNS